MKKIITSALVFMCIAQNVSFAYENTITVHDTIDNGLYLTVNGSRAELGEAELFIDENGRTQIPVRNISELLGCNVDWNNESKLVTIEHDNDIINLTIGSNIMIVNGVNFEMDTIAVIKNDFTYIPIRFIGEALKCNIVYSNSDNEFIGEVGDETVDDTFYSGMLEDEAIGITTNLIKDEDKYSGENIPDEYMSLLSKEASIHSDLIGHTVADIQASPEIPVPNLSLQPLDLSDGSIEFKIPDDTNDFYEYESVPITNHGSTILIAYCPQNTTNTVSDNAGLPIYLRGYNSTLRTYSFNVGWLFSKYGEITIAKVTGLREDRDYTVQIQSENIKKTDNAVIKVISIDE